jgi:hypothetical protein
MSSSMDFPGDRQWLWLDYSDYAGRLLGGGEAPWCDAAELIAWYRKAQGLLGADVIALPVGRVAAAWAREHAAVREAMAAGRGKAGALRALLADEPMRQHLRDVFSGLRASFGRSPLALALPAPGAFVGLAHALIHDGAALEIGEDEIDDGAMYLADFVRAFGDSGIDTVLIEEAAGEIPDEDTLALYKPMLNIAGHYRWSIGLRLSSPGSAPPAGFSYLIAPGPGGERVGVTIPDGFWGGEDAPGGALRYASVPPDAQPEAVLARLAALR